jgi:hypothetical protein
MILRVFAEASSGGDGGNSSNGTQNNVNFQSTNRGGTIFPNPRQIAPM